MQKEGAILELLRNIRLAKADVDAFGKRLSNAKNWQKPFKNLQKRLW